MLYSNDTALHALNYLGMKFEKMKEIIKLDIRILIVVSEKGDDR